MDKSENLDILTLLIILSAESYVLFCCRRFILVALLLIMFIANDLFWKTSQYGVSSHLRMRCPGSWTLSGLEISGYQLVFIRFTEKTGGNIHISHFTD